MTVGKPKRVIIFRVFLTPLLAIVPQLPALVLPILVCVPHQGARVCSPRRSSVALAPSIVDTKPEVCRVSLLHNILSKIFPPDHPAVAQNAPSAATAPATTSPQDTGTGTAPAASSKPTASSAAN